MLDSKAVVEEVEKYRKDWKPPEKTTVVLLAESHAHTTDAEFDSLLKKDYTHSDGTRCRYVNFVYCIGNSESYALENEETTPHATSQYWRVLYSCLHPPSEDGFHKFEAGSSKDRVARKIGLLTELKDAGIWLLDSSIVGINVLDREARRDVIRKCWDKRLASVLKGLKKRDLRSVILIGRPVELELRPDVSAMNLDVRAVLQPQAHVKGGYMRFYKRIH